MQDARGDVLYVGKARALRNRVTNYTQVAKLPKRLQRMVAQTRSMTIVTTRTEAEALLLEAQLIKRFRPPTTCFCAMTKASRSSSSARITHFRAFRSIAVRGASRASIMARSRAPDRSLEHLTRFRNSSCEEAVPTAISKTARRPCLLYQIKRCSAPCVGRIGRGGL